MQFRAEQKFGSKEIIMRHRKGGFKLGRNTSHRRALLRNLVTSIILNDRVHTTITKAKATRPIVEKMITLGKNGSVHARRQALAYLMGPESVDRLFSIVAPRYETRPGGYSRIVRTGVRKGDASEMAFIELLGAEQELSDKAAKREENRAKRREELQKQLEERAPGEESDPSATS
jgi:large subunit ribosomal protein L17